jgi:peptide/nickel transport system ATP-binding protein
MYKGSIVEENTIASIFKNPQQPYTRALLACRPALHPKNERLPVVDDFLKVAETPPTKSKNNWQPSTGEVLISVKHLSVDFPAKKTFFGKPLQFYKAVNNVNFDIYKGETLGLVGESGCGKTTLGRTLLRLVESSHGSIIYQGQDISRVHKNQLGRFRKEVQLIFQDPFSSLNPRLTIGDAIEEPMLRSAVYTSAAVRRQKAQELLAKVSLPATAMRRYPHEFSGGQRQRIVIARALSMNPAFLVCDESVSALDVSVQAQVLNLLNDLKSELGLTMLFISHDLSVVRYMCDRIMVMNKGEVVETGDAENLYEQPQSGYTKELIDAIPKIRPEWIM